jgi:hypothetical protein
MFDRLVERFCEFDDFCNAVRAEWKAMLLSNSKASDRQYGPEGANRARSHTAKLFVATDQGHVFALWP